MPLSKVLRTNGRALVLETASVLATFLIFYLLTVFCLSRGRASWVMVGKNFCLSR